MFSALLTQSSGLLLLQTVLNHPAVPSLLDGVVMQSAEVLQRVRDPRVGVLNGLHIWQFKTSGAQRRHSRVSFDERRQMAFPTTPLSVPALRN